MNQARQHLGSLIEQAHYLGRPFVIKRGNKLMAALIGSHEFVRILDLIEHYDPGLADALAIQTNPDIQAILEEDEKHIQKGELIPLEQAVQ